MTDQYRLAMDNSNKIWFPFIKVSIVQLYICICVYEYIHCTFFFLLLAFFPSSIILCILFVFNLDRKATIYQEPNWVYHKQIKLISFSSKGGKQ